MAADRERARRRHRALADPSRARLLDELAEGPLDAHELSRRVGLHVNTVRAHLGALAEAGLVRSETVAPQGRGRPRHAYRLVGEPGEVGGRRYRLLAEILTSLVARYGGDAEERLEEIGESWGHHLVESPREGDAVGQLVDLLAEVGFEPELERRARRAKILMRPCPFLELARRHQDVVCPIHLGLMRGALAELGSTTTATRLEPFVRPNLCVAHLSG